MTLLDLHDLLLFLNGFLWLYNAAESRRELVEIKTGLVVKTERAN